MTRMLWLWGLLLSMSAAATERYALVVGNNKGDPGRATLWFAEQDATRIALTLQELGDFPADRVMVLEGKGVADLQKAFEVLEGHLKEAKARLQPTLLFVYFSGHASREGIELGPERVSYEQLRARLAKSSADTKVAIVDACGAGELTQVKGGRPAPEINFTLPNDEHVEGTALIASTAAGELAQESAALGGSFFTHYFETALRGAGDLDGDGRVTLNEAFHYAVSQTVTGTFSTNVGPQHPTYRLQMSGRGEVVLAELKRAQSSVLLPPGASAQYLVRGPMGLTVEAAGAARAQRLALPAGAYDVERRLSGQRPVTSFVLAPGEAHPLEQWTTVGGDLRTMSSKGGEHAWAPLLYVGALGETGPTPGAAVMPGASVGARLDFGRFAARVSLGVETRSVSANDYHYVLTTLEGSVGGLYSVFRGTWRLDVGLEAGYGVAFQGASTGSAQAEFGAGGVVAEGWWQLDPHFSVGLQLFGGGRRIALDGTPTLQPSAHAALVVGYLF